LRTCNAHGRALNRSSTRRDKRFNEVSTRRVASTLVNLVHEFGPENRETVFRAVVSRWDLTRLGRSIRQSLDKTARNQDRRNTVYINQF